MPSSVGGFRHGACAVMRRLPATQRRDSRRARSVPDCRSEGRRRTMRCLPGILLHDALEFSRTRRMSLPALPCPFCDAVAGAGRCGAAIRTLSFQGCCRRHLRQGHRAGDRQSFDRHAGTGTAGSRPWPCSPDRVLPPISPRACRPRWRSLQPTWRSPSGSLRRFPGRPSGSTLR